MKTQRDFRISISSAEGFLHEYAKKIFSIGRRKNTKPKSNIFTIHSGPFYIVWATVFLLLDK